MNGPLADYRERGFAVLGGVLATDDLRRLRAALDSWRRERGESGPYGILRNNVRCEVPAVEELVATGGLAATACRFLESSAVALFQDNLVWKHPGSARIEWHQDYSYQPLDSPNGLTLWLCLDHASPRSGCLHYIPGTHKLGERVATDFFAGTGQPMRKDLPPLDWRSRLGEVKPMAAQPGELLAHHPFVWHMSPVNDSTRPRRAISVNWVTEQVRWKPSQAPHPFNYELGLADGDPFDDRDFPVFSVG